MADKIKGISYFKLVKDVDPEEELMEAFRAFDKTPTGTISVSELKHVV